MSRSAGILLVATLVGCAGSPGRFTRSTVMWVDDDRHPFGPQPEERYAPQIWDAADNLVFRPAARALAFETSGESTNVNAMDEVPDSSWFTNRLGRHAMTPEEVALGACDHDEPMPSPPWRVVEGKVDGATAGFVFEDSFGRRYVLKADREAQPEQATAADAIGAALYHAVGYFVPCNRVVFFEPDWIELDPDARIDPTHGVERDMTEEDLDEVYSYLRRAPDGRLRGLASLYLDGEPLGPWDYRGTWDRDLNDVVDHQTRRELRGMFVLNAFVDHWDARQHNTLSTWVEVDDDAGYVRHNLVDFGDTLGFVQGTHRRATRLGRSEYFDTQHIAVDFLTLGLLVRPWDRVERGPTWPVLGYFDVESFEPDQWRPNYWNGAFEERTERDCAWMARILARLREPHLRALVELGRWSDPAVERRLLRVLRGRREKVLERWLDRRSPLAWPRTAEGGVCLEDLAVSSGLRDASARRYRAEEGEGSAAISRPVRAAGAQVCVRLGRSNAAYRIVRVTAGTPGERVSSPLELHLRDGRVVGIERPSDEGRL